MVAPGDRLSRLEMSEAGHDPVGARFGLLEERPLQGLEGLPSGVALLADLEAEIYGHLVVAAPRRVEALGGLSDELR